MFNATEHASGVSTHAEFAQNTTSQTPTAVDLRVARYCVFGPIFLFSVTGNTLVILTVLLLRKMKTVPMIFIANLAACDLTTTVSSIAFDLPVEELGYWPYGSVLCKIIWPLATFSTNAAALTLVAISLDRYFSIICPLNLKCRITKGKCLKMILAIHCVSAFAVAPYAVFLEYNIEDKPSCGENWPEGLHLAKIYTVLLFALQYGLPLIIMSAIYTRIGLTLCKNTRKAAALSKGQSRYRAPVPASNAGHKLHNSASNASENNLLKRKRQNEKTAKMFLFVVVIFLVFMMPHQLLYLSYDYSSHTQAFKDNEELIVLVCRAFTYANSVLNAIIYGVCNGNFRRGCLSIVKCQCSKASQRRQARKKRTDSIHFANRHRKLHNSSSFRSACTPTTDCVSAPIREKEEHNMHREAFHDKTAPSLSNGAPAKSLIRGVKAKDGLQINEINGNSIYMRKPSQHSFTKSETHKSLYENQLSSELFHPARENDTSYWLNETETLLNRLYEELDTTGEKGLLLGQQQETSKSTENWANGMGEKETIL